MLSKTLLLLILNFTLPIYHSTSSFKNIDCKKYKAGSFYFFPANKIDTHFYSIKRNDTVQIEKDLVNGQMSKFKIKWLTNCSYTLQFIDASFELSAEELQDRKTIVLTTYISGGTDKYFLFETRSNKNWPPLKDTMWLFDKHSPKGNVL